MIKSISLLYGCICIWYMMYSSKVYMYDNCPQCNGSPCVLRAPCASSFHSLDRLNKLGRRIPSFIIPCGIVVSVIVIGMVRDYCAAVESPHTARAAGDDPRTFLTIIAAML